MLVRVGALSRVVASRAKSRIIAASLVLLCIDTARSADALPQWDAGLKAGVAGVGDHARLWQRSRFFGGAHLDVLFARQSPRDVGIGPFVDLDTAGFDDLRVALGPSAQIPLSSLSLVGAAGAYMRPTETRFFSYGFHGTLFIGSRSYNYHAPYSPAVGVVLGIDTALDRSRQTLLSVAVQLDAELLALPMLALCSWLRPHA